MYYPERYERVDASSPSGAYLTAEEIREISDLLLELRGVTLSRKTFAAATDFLTRFGREPVESSLVQPDRLPQ